MISKRDIMISTAAAGVLAASKPFSWGAFAQSKTPHALPPLLYAYNALEPHIDEATMRLHHDKHHADYVEKLNKAVASIPALAEVPVDQLLLQLNEVPDDIRTQIRNNGGGHANHTMFWTVMGKGEASQPQEALSAAITKSFGSLEQFQGRFNKAGEDHFGSGWVFLAMNPQSRELSIVTKMNQDSPLLDGLRVVFGNDLWEHAYYLKYNNKKADYLKAWWNVLNWREAGRRFEAIAAGEAVV